MKTVIFTVGVSASGKSTWARSHIGVPIVERDLIRKEILAEKGHHIFSWDAWNPRWEKEVTNRWKKKIKDLLVSDQSIPVPSINNKIIVSDTNLNAGRLLANIRWIQSMGHECLLKFFPISFEEAIRRDNARSNGVGYSVIARQFDQWNKMTVKQHDNDEVSRKPKCILVDLDGTLANMNGNRSPYDYSKVIDDLPNTNLILLLKGLIDQDIHIVILSGREAVPQCKRDTIDWLNIHFPYYTQLLMRKEGDHRSDVIVKKELFQESIEPFFNVLFAFDDRPKIIRLWRSMGIETFALGNQLIEF